MLHKPGNKYSISNSVYLLCAFILNEKEYAVLISLDDYGNRYVDPVEVEDFNRITAKEMELIAGHDSYKLYKQPITI